MTRPTARGAGNSVDRERVLVVCGNLIIAETVTIALNQLTFSARFVVPVTVAHLEDLVDWRPVAALVDVESVDAPVAAKSIAVLCAAGVAVVALSGRRDSAVVARCLTAGATTVVDKGAPLSLLTEVMHRVTTGSPVLEQGERDRLVFSSAGRARTGDSRLAAFDILTTRERFVLAELMDGRVAEVIAAQSCFAVSTVRSQIKSILQKLGVNSQLAAAALARNAGWTLERAVRDPGGSASRHHPFGAAAGARATREFGASA
jgi:DNA-binding NarL/FixJ family response regulator